MNINPTRGFGILEKFLAIKRARIANSLIPHEIKRERILDIGCGIFPIFLNSITFKEKYGLDKNVLTTLKNIHFVQQDIEKNYLLPFVDESLNVVTMLGVIEHINPKITETVCKEIYRILQPKGIFIITSPNKWTTLLLQTMTRIKLTSREEIMEHKQLYAPSEILDILVKSGFLKEGIDFGYFEFKANVYYQCRK